MSAIINMSRRDFLKTSAVISGGLVIGFSLPVSAVETMASPGMPFAPNAWVRIGADDTVTIICARSEMGQGVYTAMPMLVAEELEVDLAKVRIEFAPANPAAYINRLLGGQITGGSTSVRDAWTNLREAGAAARLMLVQAGAETWGVPVAACRAENGTVVHSSGKRLTYGQLASKAASLPVPGNISLKPEREFKLVGKSARRLDTPAKVQGSAVFGIDVRLPGMLHASLLQCPVIGGRALRVDDRATRKVKGVRAVVRIDDGVAVVADHFWAALKGRGALKVTWDYGPNAGLQSTDISRGLRAAATKPGAVVKLIGNPEAALDRAAKIIEAEYELPFLAHATMEPMNFTAHVQKNRCNVYGGTQFQQLAQTAAAKAAGLAPEQVRVHTTFLGGGFGRRIDVDFIIQAVQIAKAVGRPVKLIWTREDDMQHDFYRPASYHRVRAGIDERGQPAAVSVKFASPSVSTRLFPSIVKEGLDPFMTEAAALPYAIPNMRVEAVIHDTGVRVGYWRSVSHALNTFVNESIIDEMAVAAAADPFEYRRVLLAGEPRLKRVLELAAERAGWGSAPSPGRARGLAVMEGYGTYLAHVAEVSVAKDGQVRVHRIVCALDCGAMVNPDTVRAQAEGGIAFGLTATLKSAITFRDGRVQQSNFHDYPMVHLNEMPQVEIHLTESRESPGGMGEPTVALVAPAVANAVFAATGKRIRRLPIRPEDIKTA